MLQPPAFLLVMLIHASVMPASCLQSDRLQGPDTKSTSPGVEDFQSSGGDAFPPDISAARFISDLGTSGRSCSGKPYRPPRCAACQLNNANASRIFVLSRGDGLGERSMSLIFTMAWAAAHGFNFGGVITGKKCSSSHGVNTHRAMSSLFGQDRDTLFLTNPPLLDEEYTSWESFQGNLPRLLTSRQSNIGWTASDMYVWNDALPPVSSKFVQALRSGAKFRSRTFEHSETRMQVALHVRRDDISSVPGTHGQWRFTQDEWYYKLVAKLRELMTDRMDVHVFSSTGPLYSKQYFERFRSRGMILHINTDVFETWSLMARADILVMAQSSFSFIPGLFNQRCVLDMRHFFPPDSPWQDFVSFESVEPDVEYLDSPEFESALSNCSESILRSYLLDK
mmetsp:Transcript_5823/g.7941  ORF Transcript_5823/g.7941 Transcript_5823/m.7941 type:complete len:395 (+) Transcript_5823:82-1266(+)